MNRRFSFTAIALTTLGFVAALVISCKQSKSVVSNSPEKVLLEHTDSVTFKDMTKAAGITWKHVNGADGRKFFPEENGSGIAIFDYNNDGWQDILMAQCRHWPGHRAEGAESTMVLYRNNHDGTFTDVTKEAGLNIPMFSLGVSACDYDNDGWADLYMSNMEGNYLFHNDHGKFVDVTKKAGVVGYGNWCSSSMWVDYDNDGFLDLLAVHYAYWTPQTDIYCTIDGKVKSYCTPQLYPGQYLQMFHNNHDGTFTDATKQCGMKDQKGHGFEAIMMDYDEDGWTDILVSNDLTPNRLYHNEKGVFKEVGVEAGIAYDEGGVARAGMGNDWADADRDGKPTVFIANFAGEMNWVYKYAGNGVFVDRAPQNGIGTFSLPYLKFGLVVFDYDYDGYPDLFQVCGHVQPEIEMIQRTTAYKMPSLLFRNQGNGKFEEVGLTYMKGPFERRIVGRGVAYGDLNNDGSIDVVACSTNDYPLLFINERKNTNHYLRIKLEGSKSNRDGIGARVYAKVGKMNMMELMKSGSCLSGSNEPWVTLGLGQNTKVDELTIKWNCGTVDVLHDVQGDRAVLVKEGTNAAENYQWQK